MPILEVEVVGDPEPGLRSGLAARIARGAAEALESPPGATWVRLRSLARADYAEGDGGPGADVEPVFVRLLLARPPAEDVLTVRLERLTDAVAAACGRPRENVHVLLEPEAEGRMAFGGVRI